MEMIVQVNLATKHVSDMPGTVLALQRQAKTDEARILQRQAEKAEQEQRQCLLSEHEVIRASA